jgi:hypothetical protein
VRVVASRPLPELRAARISCASWSARSRMNNSLASLSYTSIVRSFRSRLRMRTNPRDGIRHFCVIAVSLRQFAVRRSMRWGRFLAPDAPALHPA